jgi:prefoldin, archaeal alpha subunit/eukaryotic subunit 5
MNDDELRQALTVREAYMAQLDMLTQQVQLLQMSVEEAARAQDTLRNLKNAKEGDEILIPIGAASFIPAKVSATGKAIVGIGNRVSVEKSIDDAVTYMKSNVDEITAALKKAAETLNEVETAARNLTAAINQESQRRQ